MAWFRVHLTAEQQRIVNEERVAHPDLRAREKMLVLWLLHCGAKPLKEAAKVVSVQSDHRPPVRRRLSPGGGLERFRSCNHHRPQSEMAAFRDVIRESFEKQPARTVAEAGERIFQLTGLRHDPNQVHKFLKDLGQKFPSAFA